MVTLPAPRLLVVGAAAVLTLAGFVGLQQASGHRLFGRSLEPMEGERGPMEGAMSKHLARRELTLDLRRESELLIQQFIRAQMTRHYWGQFASSLTDLGLSSGELLDARVESDARKTRLWLSYPQATEAYLAVFQRGSLAWPRNAAKAIWHSSVCLLRGIAPRPGGPCLFKCKC